MRPRFGLPALLVWLCWWLLGGQTSATASTVYVASLADLQNAVNSAGAGDTIIVSNGLYVANSPVAIKCVGASNAPIRIKAETLGGAVIGGNFSFQLQAPAAWVTVQGFCFTNAGSQLKIESGATHCRLTRNFIQCTIPAGDASGLWYVQIAGDDAVFDHNELCNKNSTGQGLSIIGDGTNQVARRLWVHHNYFHDFVHQSGANGVETVRWGLGIYAASSGDGLMEYNLFDRCDGEAEMVSNKSCNNTYRFNTFMNTLHTQVKLRQGTNCLVYGNYFTNTSGLCVYGYYHQVFNNYFANNSVAVQIGNGDTNALVFGDAWHVWPVNCVVAFNTLVSNTAQYWMDTRYGFGASNNLFANNLIVGSAKAADFQAQPYYSGSWTNNLIWNSTVSNTAAGDLPAGAYLKTNPLVTLRDVYGVLHLQSNSPAIGAAAPGFANITADFDGQPRPGTGKDIGADQFSSAPVTAHFLTPSEVGVSAPGDEPPSISAIADRSLWANTNAAAIALTVDDPFYAPGLLTIGAAAANPNLVPASGLVPSGLDYDRTLLVTPAGGLAGSTLVTVTVTNPAGLTAATTFLLTLTNWVASTNQLLDARWADATRTNASPPTNSAWYASSAASLVARANALVGSPDPAVALHWWTYFTTNAASPVSLRALDTLRVTLSFTLAGVNPTNSSRGLRLGLFNSALGTRTAADGAPPVGTNLPGYLLALNLGETLGGNPTIQFLKRTNLASANLLGTVTDYSASSLAPGSSGPPAGSAGFSNALSYTMQLLFTRNTNSLDFSSTCSNASGWKMTCAAADTNNFVSAFDTFCVRPASAAQTATNFTFTEFKVELIAASNQPPVAAAHASMMVQDQPLVLSASDLLASDFDPDGDSLEITSVSGTSTNHAAVSLDNGRLTYTPPNGYIGTDRLSYTLKDARGATVTGHVLVTMIARPNILGAFVTNGLFQLNFSGAPGSNYWIVSKTNLRDALWQPIATNTADANGLSVFHQPAATNNRTRFFRLQAP